jgi:hypothetical protein
LPPEAGADATFARDREDKAPRHGQPVSQVHGLVKDGHRSRE